MTDRELIKQLRCFDSLSDVPNPAAADRIEQTEAKLAIAVESIKQSIKLWEKYDDTELKWDRDRKLDNAYDGFELLSKALAELEGRE